MDQKAPTQLPSLVLRKPDTNGSSPVLAPGSPGVALGSVGRFRILGEIARGGVGVVLMGHDADLGREVAVKVLRDEFSERSDVLRRFVEEAQIGGQLQHPGIVPVYELGLRDDGRPFFAMKLVRGRTLAAALADRRSPADDLGRYLGILEAICQTLAYAHARGVIHRDVKPSNVMIGAFGEVQLVDWGLAKVLAQDVVHDDRRTHAAPAPAPDKSAVTTVRTAHGSPPSVVGSMLGTPQYMSREQARGEIDCVDERSDVFSLGAILCEVLTGAPPYRGTAIEVAVMAGRADLTDATTRLDACDADADLVELTKGCLAPEAAARPRNAGEVARQLGAYLSAVEERARSARVAAAEARTREAEERATAEAEKAAARQARIEADEQRREATDARRATRRTISVAAWLALLGGAGAWIAWIAATERAERVRMADGRVVAAMEAATLLRGHAAAEQDLDDWDDAKEQAAGALEVAGDPNVSAEWRAAAARMAASIDGEVATVKAAQEHDRRGVELSRDDDMDGAIAEFRRAIDLLPGHGSFHVHLGNAHYRRRSWTDAIDAFRTAVRLEPESAATRRRLVLALLAAGDPEHAVGPGREMVRMEPDSAELHVDLGHALRDLGDFDAAEHAFREALRYAPEWGVAAADLAALDRDRKLATRIASALAGPPGATSPEEWESFAEFAHARHRFTTAAECWSAFLRHERTAAAGPGGDALVHGARAASLASEGHGIESASLDSAARAAWLRQARTWFAAFVAASRTRADAGSATATDVNLLRRSRSDAALAAIRDPANLAALPEDERAALAAIWADVDSLLDRATR